MIAAVAEVGRPSVSSGTSVPAAEALLAASGPATPSIAPLPNSSGCLDSFFSVRVGQEGRDLRAARRHRADREADDGAAQPRLPRALPVLLRHPERALQRLELLRHPARGRRRRRAPRRRRTGRPRATTTSMPSSSSGTPNAKRAWPVWLVDADQAEAQARGTASRGRARSTAPKAADTVMKASTISAKYSAGPNPAPTSTTTGARKREQQRGDACRRRTSRSPRSRAPGRRGPRFAILLPSSAVTIEAVSPGVLSRIEVVEPPYMPP